MGEPQAGARRALLDAVATSQGRSPRTVAQHTGCAYCASLGKPAARQQDEKEALAVAFAEALAAEHTATFQKGLGAVHAMAHPLGALDELPLHHGTLNAVRLPAVLRYNEPAAIEKYDRLRRVTGLDAGDDLATWIAELNARIGLPDGLAAMGVPTEVLPDIAAYAEHDPATERNPRPATRADYEDLLRASWSD